MGKKVTPLPVRKTNCKTCLWLDNQKPEWACVKDMLMQRALESTPICHSTGKALVRHNGERLKAHACRGARDFQLQFFTRIGFLSEATDEAWAAKWEELQRGKS